MKKKQNKTSHKFIITSLIIIVLLLAAVLTFVLFPTKFINIDGKKILSTMEIADLNNLNEHVPGLGTLFVSVHYTDKELSTLVKEPIVSTYPVNDIAISFNDSGTVDVAISTGDFKTFFSGQSLPSFLTGVISSQNIYSNISVTHESGNRVNFKVNSAYLGDLSIPPALFTSITDELTNKVEANLNQIDGFSLTSIIIESDVIKINGVIKK